MVEHRRIPPSLLIGAAACIVIVTAAFAAYVLRWMHESRIRQNEVGAVGSLRTIATSESVFRESDKDPNGWPDYGTLAQLSQAQLVDAALGTGTKQGYLFAAGPSTSTSEFLWFAVASPEVPGETGRLYFCENQAAVIFYTTTGAFGLNTTDCVIADHALPVGK